MCGFVGMIGLNGRKPDRRIIQRMSSVIKHRGPDEEGYYQAGPVGFGFRRLSILDLSLAGHQPMFSPDGQRVIVFNGEIYNYVELRDELKSLGHTFRSSGDTEVLLHSYIEWGTDCVNRFNGMWAFIIYDIQQGKLFGSRDRFGKKPLYRYQRGDYIFFASEIKAILSSGHYHGGPNWAVVSRFLLGSNLAEIQEDNNSFYSEIQQIPAGSVFELSLSGRFREWRYWALIEEDDLSNEDPGISYYRLFEDSVRLRLRSDVPLGVFLSGGLDSTSVICALANINNQNGKSFNPPVTAVTYHSPEFDESGYIQDTIKRTGADLIRYESNPHQLWNTLNKYLYYQDEPVHSFASVIFFELCKAASERGIKVMLAGGGADEYLAGYFGYFTDYWYTLLRGGRISSVWNEITSYSNVHGKDRRALLRMLLRQFIGTELRRFRYFSRLNYRKRYKNDWFLPELTEHLQEEEHNYELPTLNTSLKQSVEKTPLPLYLREDDRSTMAHSIEGRSPFLDHRLVSYAFQLPDNWKLRGPLNKYVLREAMRGKIPESVRSRPDKMGFSVPQRAWFADLLQAPFQDMIGSQGFRERGIYNVEAIRRDLELHRQGKVDCSSRFFNLIQFEIWSKLEKDYSVKRSETVSEITSINSAGMIHEAV